MTHVSVKTSPSFFLQKEEELNVNIQTKPLSCCRCVFSLDLMGFCILLTSCEAAIIPTFICSHKFLSYKMVPLGLYTGKKVRKWVRNESLERFFLGCTTRKLSSANPERKSSTPIQFRLYLFTQSIVTRRVHIYGVSRRSIPQNFEEYGVTSLRWIDSISWERKKNSVFTTYKSFHHGEVTTYPSKFWGILLPKTL